MSSKLRLKVLPLAHEAGQSPAEYLFTLSLFLSLPFPPTEQDYGPMWPSIYHVNRAGFHTWWTLQLLPLLWLSHFSHSHLWSARKVEKQTLKVSIKASKWSKKKIHFTIKQNNLLLINKDNPNTHSLLSCSSCCGFVSSSAFPGSFRLWFPSGTQNGSYLFPQCIMGIGVKCCWTA